MFQELTKENDRLARELKTVSIDRDHWRGKLKEKLKEMGSSSAEHYEV